MIARIEQIVGIMYSAVGIGQYISLIFISLQNVKMSVLISPQAYSFRMHRKFSIIEIHCHLCLVYDLDILNIQIIRLFPKLDEIFSAVTGHLRLMKFLHPTVLYYFQLLSSVLAINKIPVISLQTKTYKQIGISSFYFQTENANQIGLQKHISKYLAAL